MSNGNTPAMPVIEESKTEQYNGGTYTTATTISLCLTKREQFAMAAMQGILSIGNESATEDIIASCAVTMADALLEELERTK